MNISAFGLNSFSSSGGEQLLLCPFHSDHKPSAWWNPVRNVFYCSVCGMGLNAKQLADRLGISLDGIEDDYEDEAIEDYDLTTEDYDYSRIAVLDAGHAYFSQRKIKPETVRRYGVGVVLNEPQSVRFNLTDINHKPTGFVERFIEPGISQRYRKSGKQQPLWPMNHLLSLQPYERIYIFEGPFSAMRWHSYGLNFGMDWFGFALMGAKANLELAHTVRDLNCVFLYDHDAAGINACYKMRSLLPLTPCYTLSISVDDMDDRQIENLTMSIMRKVEWK